MRANLKDLIGTRIELRLGDPSDSEIDRKAAANVPRRRRAAASARAACRCSRRPAARRRRRRRRRRSPTASTISCARIAETWTGAPGPKLRLLPELITLDEVRALAPADIRQILLGVDEANLAPFGIDPIAEPLLYLYGDADSGKSSMLRVVAHEIMRLYGSKEAKIFLLDYRRALLGEIPDDYLLGNYSNNELATDGIRDLATFFRSRMPGPDVTAEQLRTRSWWTGAEGFVLVDDYDLVATSRRQPARPARAAARAGGRPRAAPVVARRAGGASRGAYSDPILLE